MIVRRILLHLAMSFVVSKQTWRQISLLKIAWIMSAFLVIVPMASAQGTGTISGYVRDASGAALSGTSVTAVMAEQHTTRTAQTDAQGFYNFVAMPVGHYTITFAANGFKTEVRSNVELTVSQNVRADSELTVGAVNTEVHVSSTVPLVDTTTNTMSGLVDDRRVVDLPLNGRNIMSLAGILPGVTNVSAPQTMTNARGGSQMIVNGSFPNSVVYMFDGGYFQNPSRNTGLNYPPPDAIAQFRMLTANFGAEYGHNSGGQVEVVSKSGTESFHGTAWEFLRNNAFNAKDYFALKVPIQKQNQFGAVVGGPIIRRKLFFFASYQGFTNHGQAITQRALVPDAAERAGNFTELTTVLKDPTDPITGLPLTDPNTGAPCVAGNIISPGCISPVATSFLKYVPTSSTGFVTSLGSSPQTNNNGNIRVDWNQSEKNLIFGHYYQDQLNYDNPFPATSNLAGYMSESFSVITQDGVVNDIYTFSPSLINQGIFSILNSTSNQVEDKTIDPQTQGIDLPQYLPSGAQTVTVTGNFVVASGAPTHFLGTNYQVADNLSWLKGRHNFKFGGEWLKLNFHQVYISPPQFTFDGVRSNNAVADFMLGAYDTVGVSFGIRNNNVTSTYPSLYAQDQYRITPRLILNYGLRWEPYFPWKGIGFPLETVIPNQQSTVDPTAPPGILFPGDKGVSPGIAPADLNNFAPRVGFVWDVNGDGKTSVRGGYGIFYNSINGQAVAQANAPFAGSQTGRRGNAAEPFNSTGQVTPPAVVSGHFDCVPISTYPFVSCPLWPLPLTPLDITNKSHLAHYHEYNLSIQRQITPSTMIELAYVGNTGVDVDGYIHPNPARFITDPITGKPPAETNVNDRVLYEPGILSPGWYEEHNYAHSNYNSLQVSGQKRFGHGATILASYTWAKLLGQVETAQTAANLSNPFNLEADYGIANQSRTNSFVISWLYNLPIHFSNSVANSLLGGWTLTAIQTVQSGLPLTFFMGTDVAVDGTGGSQYAQLQPGANADTIRLNHSSRQAEVAKYFNTQAFVTPNLVPLGTYGNSTKGMDVGPAYANTDASLLKVFTLPKTMSLEFRLESFNTFNQVNFAIPNTNASGGSFGRILSTQNGVGRQLQLAAKLHW